jgi:hypothetical protein
MTRNTTLYCQKQVAAALIQEFGFAPARLNQIVLMEVDEFCFHILFRIGNHYYTYDFGKIEREN